MSRPQIPTALTTSSLVLRATRPAFADDLWRAAARSIEQLRAWLVWADDASPATMRTFTAESQQAWNAGLSWGFTVFFEERPVGHVGLAKFTPQLASVEIGYWISSDVSGRGFMTEAAGAVAEFAFEDLRLHRVELRAAPENLASVRVAEKLGFTREGLARSACRGAHGWHDVYVFGLLESDPRPGRFVIERSYNQLDETDA